MFSVIFITSYFTGQILKDIKDSAHPRRKLFLIRKRGIYGCPVDINAGRGIAGHGQANLAGGLDGIICG